LQQCERLWHLQAITIVKQTPPSLFLRLQIFGTNYLYIKKRFYVQISRTSLKSHELGIYIDDRINERDY